MMKSYCEIGGEVICSETPIPRTLSIVPEISQSLEIESIPVPGDSDFIGPVQAPGATVGISPISRPYTVGVGVGNPIFWAASNALIYSIGIASGSKYWPETTANDKNLY